MKLIWRACTDVHLPSRQKLDEVVIEEHYSDCGSQVADFGLARGGRNGAAKFEPVTTEVRGTPGVSIIWSYEFRRLIIFIDGENNQDQVNFLVVLLIWILHLVEFKSREDINHFQKIANSDSSLLTDAPVTRLHGSRV